MHIKGVSVGVTCKGWQWEPCILLHAFKSHGYVECKNISNGIALCSYVSVTFILESMATANALIRLQSKVLEKSSVAR